MRVNIHLTQENLVLHPERKRVRAGYVGTGFNRRERMFMKPFGQKWAAVALLSSLSTSVAGVCAAQTAEGNTEGSVGIGAGGEIGAEVEGEAAAEPVPPEPPPPPPPEPPPVVEAPAPPPPPLIRVYGLIKPTLIAAGRPVESYSQLNASAATAAANPVLMGTFAHDPSYTLQVAQSRLGFWFGEGQPVRGQFELDFIDFGKSSPTVQALPRLRIAKVEWSLSDSTVLMVGQDWDLFGSINPHTINLVGAAFQSGNTGFMRQQAKLIWHNDSLEVGGALGLPGINAAARAALPEFNGLPSIAARAALLLGKTGRIGVNGIATLWRFAPKTPAQKKSFAGAAGIYGDVTPAERFNLRFEAYYGQNLANMGALSLGFGRASLNAMGEAEVVNMNEVGGFLSAKYGFSDQHAVYGTFGLAKVLNDDDVVQSYTPPVVDAMGNVTSAAALNAANGPGMKQNLSARLGYEYRYDKSIAFLFEGFLFQTEHQLDETTRNAGLIKGDVGAAGVETGLLFTL